MERIPGAERPRGSGRHVRCPRRGQRPGLGRKRRPGRGRGGRGGGGGGGPPRGGGLRRGGGERGGPAGGEPGLRAGGPRHIEGRILQRSFQLQPAAACIFQSFAGDFDARVGADHCAGFVHALAVDARGAGENQRLGALARFGKTAFDEELIEAFAAGFGRGAHRNFAGAGKRFADGKCRKTSLSRKAIGGQTSGAEAPWL